MTRRVEKVSLSCAQCGKEFEKYPSQILKGRGTFCSKACLGLSKRTGSQLDCSWCGSRFYRHMAEQDSERSFCSRPCYMKWRANQRTSYPKLGSEHVHRVVAARVLGRALLPGEVVHHIDLDKQNHDPSNLAVFPSQADHARCHFGGMSDDELRSFSLIQAPTSSTGRH